MTGMFDHPDARAFLAAMRAAPDDDTPRLVFADWLEEHAGDVECERCGNPSDGLTWTDPFAGEPRGQLIQCPACGGTGRASDGRRELAELIRVQCGLAAHPGHRLNPDATYGEYADLRKRQRAILDAHGRRLSGRDWHYVSPEPGAPKGERASVCVYRRGFADLARFPDVPAFLAAAPTLLTHCPLLRRVEVADREPQTGLSFGDRFVWFRPFGTETPGRLLWVLPDEIFRHMARLETSEWRMFDTRDDAFNGLSAAWLMHCELLASPPAEAQ